MQYSSPPQKFRVIGHRGAAGHAPENTLVSFQKALELGVDAVECDVHLSKDGEVVVIHDETVERTTNGSGYVKDLTTAELQRLDAGKLFDAYRGERIPLLREVCQLIRGQAGLVLEIKNGPFWYPGIEAKVVQILEQENMVENTIVIAFDHPTVKRIKALQPQLTTGILFACAFVDPWAVIAQADADAFHPQYKLVTSEMVAEAHQRGYLVNLWTINEPAHIRQWQQYGVDGIASDYPDRLAGIDQK